MRHLRSYVIVPFGADLPHRVPLGSVWLLLGLPSTLTSFDRFLENAANQARPDIAFVYIVADPDGVFGARDDAGLEEARGQAGRLPERPDLLTFVPLAIVCHCTCWNVKDFRWISGIFWDSHGNPWDFLEFPGPLSALQEW